MKLTTIFIFIISSISLSAQERSFDCTQQIKEATCVVDSFDAEEVYKQNGILEYMKSVNSRPCIEDNSYYVNELIQIHNELPNWLRPMFCEVKVIYIEKEFNTFGMARPYHEVISETENEFTTKRTGHALHLNAIRAFNRQINPGQNISKKEQLNFGRSFNDKLPKDFPLYQIDTNLKSNIVLFNIIVHEFGHFIDYENHVNNLDYSQCTDQNGEYIQGCLPDMDSLWSSITWGIENRLPQYNFIHSDKLCYYMCNNQTARIPLEDANLFFHEFYQESAFVTPYAATNSSEDFAESFTFYVLNQISNSDNDQFVQYSLNFFDSSNSINLLDNLNTKPLSYKMEYIERLVKGDLIFLKEYNQYIHTKEDHKESFALYKKMNLR